MSAGQGGGSGKISISLDEINSPHVDAEIRRQDISARMAAHQEQVEANTQNVSRAVGGGIFRNAVGYMAVFGLIASIAGWFLGELWLVMGESVASDADVGQLVAWLLWYITIGCSIGVGLSIAEPVVARKTMSAMWRGFAGLVLGLFGGILSAFIPGIIYLILGGGAMECH